ncbi:MAG: xanthine dehydrogenase small subunit [Hyphomicrobiales bacterium]|nr:xanthine dehydrogenase small subunit [Hyphomicrobiales bacterium]
MGAMKKADKVRQAVLFRFRGREVALDRFSPRLTLLDWLREEMGAKGTKEGCAEGDCGACTVVLVRARGGRLVYEAVNACILLLGQLDGAEMITVEDLAAGGTLHPVQQAMVDHHGSQCGFCTPGIVMSLFAAYHSGPQTYASLCDQLAGNLCRCTGYRPILTAALATCDGSPADRFAAEAGERAAALETLAADQADVFAGDENRFFAAPASLDALAQLYERFPDATILAGATDVGLWITKQLRDLRRVIWIGRVVGLDRIEDRGDVVSFGATVSLSDAAPVLGGLHSDLGEIMRRFGSVQVRVSGTVGGNIANGSPIGDLAPALIPLEGRVVLRKGADVRALPLEDFFIAYGKQDRRPGEFVLAVEAPRLKENEHYRAFKVSKRFDEDISAVMMAARLTLDGRRVATARIAYGGMAATPKRAALAEQTIVGADLDAPDSWGRALHALTSDFTPLTDQRASADYRMTVAQNLIRRALIEISAATTPTRLGVLDAAE